MKAVRFHSTGGPEVLRLDEVEAPAPGPGQALVAVRAAGVNFIDIYLRSGFYDPGPLPVIAGREGAGVVAALGPGISVSESETGIAVGDRVAFCDAPGSYAEEIVHRAERLVPLPGGVGFHAGAALALQGMTAHYLVRTIGQVGAGDRVLVHAAAGGVGQLAVRIAKHAGAEVFGTCSTAAKAAVAHAAGCDHVILYTEVSFADEILRLTAGRGVDFTIDGVGRTTFLDSVRATRVRGHIAFFGQASGPPEPIQPRKVLGSRTLTTATLFDYVKTRPELLQRAAEVCDAHAEGWLEVAIDRVLPFSQAAEAHRLLAGRATAGKVLLEPDS